MGADSGAAFDADPSRCERPRRTRGERSNRGGHCMLRRLAALVVVSAAAVAALVLSGGAAARGNGDANKLRTVDHIVVIYEENHSFDNLYGGWERVRGLSDADAAHTTQLGQTGPSSFAPYECLYQD